MSEEEPIDPEAQRLLDAEAARPELDEAHRARLWAGIAGRLGPDGGGSGEPPGGGSGGTPPSGLGAAAPWIAGAFLAGGITGAALHAWWAGSPEPEIVRIEVPVPVEPPHSAEPEPIVVVEAPRPIDAGAPEAQPQPAPAEEEDDELAALRAERALVEAARSALARGDDTAALMFVDRHARRFARGTMSEERDAIRVQALARSGDRAAAQVRRAAFERAYPQSLFLPTIRAALAE